MAEATLSVAVSASDHVQGPTDAPVTLVEYGDYECPYCGEAYPIVKRIQSQLGDRLRFVFRNFPLTQAHPHAAHAAEAAESADAQGRFWDMHDLLYEHQQHLEDDDLVRYATQLGLDPTTFAADMRKGTAEAKVLADFNSGVESGVNGTPTFFINGVRYDGDWQGDHLLHKLERQ